MGHGEYSDIAPSGYSEISPRKDSEPGVPFKEKEMQENCLYVDVAALYGQLGKQDGVYEGDSLDMTMDLEYDLEEVDRVSIDSASKC